MTSIRNIDDDDDSKQLRITVARSPESVEFDMSIDMNTSQSKEKVTIATSSYEKVQEYVGAAIQEFMRWHAPNDVDVSIIISEKELIG